MVDLRRRVQDISEHVLLEIGRKDGLYMSCGSEAAMIRQMEISNLVVTTVVVESQRYDLRQKRKTVATPLACSVSVS